MKGSTRSTDEIRREIQDIRGNIDHKVNSLVNLLSPGALVDLAVEQMRSGSRSRQYIGDLSERTKHNPLGAVLIAAGAYLLYSDQRLSEKTGTKIKVKSQQYKNQGQAKVRDITQRIKERSPDRSEMREKREQLKGRFQERGRQMKSDLSSKGHELSGRVKSKTREYTQRSSEHTFALGALGLAAGLLAGSMIKSSRKERELAAKASDRVEGVVQEKWERAKEVGERTLDAAKNEAKSAAEEEGLVKRRSTGT